MKYIFLILSSVLLLSGCTSKTTQDTSKTTTGTASPINNTGAAEL